MKRFYDDNGETAKHKYRCFTAGSHQTAHPCVAEEKQGYFDWKTHPEMTKMLVLQLERDRGTTPSQMCQIFQEHNEDWVIPKKTVTLLLCCIRIHTEITACYH
jgi:hypothetical protein